MRLFYRPFIILTILYAAALVALYNLGLLEPRTAPGLSAASQVYAASIKGDVSGMPEEKKGKLYFKVRVFSLNDKPAAFSVLIVTRDLSLEILPGDKVYLTGNLSPLKYVPNPGSFNYARYLQKNGMCATLYPDTVSIIKNHPWNLGAVAFRLRNNIMGVIYRYLPEKEAGILAPMIIGDQSALSDAERKEFRDAGVTHILVVSGLNVAYCAALFLWCFRLAGFPRRKAALLSMPFIILYVFITGANPPVIRAGVMALFVILSLSLKREPLIYQSLALAAAVILMFDPMSLFSASFQLSFAATLGIVYLYKYFSKPFERLPRWANYIFAGTLAVSLGAQAAVLPLLAYYFNRISLVGLVSNIFIVPLSGFITAAGLVLYLAHFISPFLAGIAAAVCIYSVRLLSALVHFFAGLPNATTTVPTPSAVFLCVYYFALWGVFRLKQYSSMKFTLLGCLVLLVVSAGYGVLSERRRTEIIFFALKDGGAAFIDFQGREKWLVDAGGSYVPGVDPGERVITPFLVSRGIRKLDKIVITHPHYTRYAGLRYIVDNFTVGSVILNPELCVEKEYAELISLVQKKKIPVKEVWAGDNFFIGESTAAVISPIVLSGATDNNCIVLSVQSYGRRILLTGDMGPEAEKRLASEGDIKCDVLQLPGREGFVANYFFSKAEPDYCVISEEKDFRAKGINCRRGIFSTADKGAVGLIIDRRGVRVRTY